PGVEVDELTTDLVATDLGRLERAEVAQAAARLVEAGGGDAQREVTVLVPVQERGRRRGDEPAELAGQARCAVDGGVERSSDLELEVGRAHDLRADHGRGRR